MTKAHFEFIYPLKSIARALFVEDNSSYSVQWETIFYFLFLCKNIFFNFEK